jgi:hypothetical protein
MLSRSIPTITEPDWTHKAIDISDLNEKINFINDHHEEGILVKYTSLICDVMPDVSGKKIFLYRNFEEHLRKLAQKPNFIIQKEAIFWSQRFLWATISYDTLYVQTDYFLKNREDTAKLVCDHFEIEYIPVDLPDDFDAKEKGYNHNNDPIKL